jgi:uncharacterized protein (DUF736 family)
MKYHFTKEVENNYNNGQLTTLGMMIEVSYIKTKSKSADAYNYLEIRRGSRDIGNNWSERTDGVNTHFEESIKNELKSAEDANDWDRASNYISEIIEKERI